MESTDKKDFDAALLEMMGDNCVAMIAHSINPMLEKLRMYRKEKEDFDKVTFKQCIEGIEEEYTEVQEAFYLFNRNRKLDKFTKLDGHAMATRRTGRELIYELADLMNYCAITIYQVETYLKNE